MSKHLHQKDKLWRAYEVDAIQKTLCELDMKLFGLPGDLVSNIINKEAYRKPQGSCKNFQGRNLDNIFVAILVQTMTPQRHFEINWPLDTLNHMTNLHKKILNGILNYKI